LQAAGLPGDYNFDGVVDGADYVVWRKGPGYLSSHYDLWRTNFGAPSGTGAGTVSGASVPEPAAATLVVWGIALWAQRRNLRRRAWLPFQEGP